VELVSAIDDSGRLTCTVVVDGRPVQLTAADAAAAADDLLAALEEAGQTGFGECVWQEAGGDYRWMFRRVGERLTVVGLWSAGTVTGWQHVLHTEAAYAPLVARMREVLVGRVNA
jgi:hypothetical protein